MVYIVRIASSRADFTVRGDNLKVVDGVLMVVRQPQPLLSRR